MRYGADVHLSSAKLTYREMILQVARDYHVDVRTLTIAEVVFFYDGLRPELKAHTRPKS